MDKRKMFMKNMHTTFFIHVSLDKTLHLQGPGNLTRVLADRLQTRTGTVTVCLLLVRGTTLVHTTRLPDKVVLVCSIRAVSIPLVFLTTPLITLVSLGATWIENL